MAMASPDRHREGLTREEEELLDRQIRVWGVDTQCAIRDSVVSVVVLGDDLSFLGRTKAEIDATLRDMNPRCNLIVEVEEVAEGNQKPTERILAAELIKNLTLAGIGNLRVSLVSDVSRLQCERSDVAIVFGTNLRETCEATELVAAKASTVLCSTVRGGCGYAFLRRHERGEARAGGVALQTALLDVPAEDLPRRVNKMYGVLRAALAFERSEKAGGRAPGAADLDAVAELSQSEISLERHRPPLDLLRNYLETQAEMPAVSAVVGGSLAQEVIKAISGKGELMDNFYFFSAYGSPDSGEAKVELIRPKEARAT